MRRRNVGVKVDPVLLVAITFGDFENAAGANSFADRLAQWAAIGVYALQHHRRIADGHKACALEHMHQGQRAAGLAGGDGGAGNDRAVDRRDQRHFVADLEHLLDVQRRKAQEALRPAVV